MMPLLLTKCRKSSRIIRRMQSSSIRKTLLNTGGQGSFRMEVWKFGIYLAIPLAASAYFNNPERMKKSAEYWQFVKYPANPVTGLREQIAETQKQSASREEYRKQLELLNRGATDDTPDSDSKVGFWKRWFGKEDN